MGYKLIVITNQSGVARGYYTEKEVNMFHEYMNDDLFKSNGLMIDKYYPSDKVFLGAFSNYSRYSGPREAVFTALCRKNFGCSHFIVGRDHTGLDGYYSDYESQDMF